MTSEPRDYVANHRAVPVGTLPELFFRSVDRFASKATLQTIAADGSLKGISYREVQDLIREVVGGLVGLGLERGRRVALLSENRPEWALLDFGCACAGIPLVPVHTTLTSSQIAFILENSRAGALFVSSSELLEVALEARQSMEEEIPLVLFDPREDPRALSWAAFLAEGREREKNRTLDEFRRSALVAEPEDAATVLYTSGTTGTPKGVELTHGNLFSNVHAIAAVLPVHDTDSTLSFLPLSHSLQRIADYVFFAQGATINYCRSLKTVAEDLLLARPTKVVGPPRFYEKAFERVMDRRGFSAFLVRWAREVGEAWADEVLAGRKPTGVLRAVYGVAHLLVFRRIRRRMGGRIIFFLSGSAPLSPEINKFFFSAGIRIMEGYGLSETSPVLTANTLEDFQVGTVGPPIPGTEIRIAEDGEVLVRGPQVMKGYLNLQKETAAVLSSEGWLKTGDVGHIDDRGHLRITDRKKDILVTAAGKNVAPAPIENLVKGSRYVDQAVLIGDRRHFPALLVVPSFEILRPWAESQGIRAPNRRALLENPMVRDLLESEVFRAFDALASYERPKKLGLLSDEFTIEGGILTPSQKVKRRAVRERYGTFIERIYHPANRETAVLVEGE